jgi:predicted RNA-binding protein Jag
MDQPFRNHLNDTVKDLLQRIGFEADVKTGEEMISADLVKYHCEITLREGQNLLIGQHGANVAALLHIVKLAVRKELPKNGVLSLDVNHYFEEKRGFLEREAFAAVKEVEESGLPVTLRPMLSFERKMIHHLFASHPSIMTESVGVGDDRKILLRRKPEVIEDNETR